MLCRAHGSRVFVAMDGSTVGIRTGAFRGVGVVPEFSPRVHRLFLWGCDRDNCAEDLPFPTGFSVSRGLFIPAVSFRCLFFFLIVS